MKADFMFALSSGDILDHMKAFKRWIDSDREQWVASVTLPLVLRKIFLQSPFRLTTHGKTQEMSVVVRNQESK